MYKGINIFQNSATEAVIDIEGYIGASRWWEDKDKDKENSLERIKKDINAIKALNATTITVNIHSLGGDIDHALAIHDALKEHTATITTNVIGMCASSATVIMMSGDTRKMSENALILIHKCSSWAWGNENEIEAELQAQRTVNEKIINIYLAGGKAQKTDIENLMNENNGTGKWITADEAKTFGLITDVYSPGESKKVAAFSKTMFDNSRLPQLPENYNFLIENKEENTFLNKLENFFKPLLENSNQQENKFNNNQTQATMKDTFPLFANLLAFADNTQFDPKKGITLNEEQLKTIEAALKKHTDTETEKTNLQNQLTAKEAKVTELQAIVDKVPTTTTTVVADDANDDIPETYTAEMKKNPYYKAVAEELGQNL